MKGQSLAPGLLIATRMLDGSEFARVVILLLEHDDEGTFGIIVNQRTDTPVSDVAEDLNLEWASELGGMIWRGGPVNPTEGRFIGFSKTPREGWIQIAEGVHALTTQKSAAEDMPDECRFVLGHAGWSPGQLADEICEGCWIASAIDVSLLMSTEPRDLWKTIMSSLGITPRNLVHGTAVN